MGVGFVTKLGPVWFFAMAQYGVLFSFYMMGSSACKMMGQFEPLGSFRTVRFHRFTSPTTDLGGSWSVQCLNGLIRQTGPDWWAVDGWTGWTGRSGLVFKTLVESLVLNQLSYRTIMFVDDSVYKNYDSDEFLYSFWKFIISCYVCV